MPKYGKNSPEDLTDEVYRENLKRHAFLAQRAMEEGDMLTLKRETRALRDCLTILHGCESMLHLYLNPQANNPESA